MVKSFPDQKEYLKKYLSGNKHKVRKNKSSRQITKGVKLIDDDETIRSSEFYNDDLILDGEDAPQIVLGEGVEPSAIKDSLKKWKKILPVESKSEKPKFLKNFSMIELPETNSGKKNSIEAPINDTDTQVNATANKNIFSSKKNFDPDDQSPPRKDSDNSLKKKYNEKYSTLRRFSKEDYISKAEGSSSDLSPARKHTSANKLSKRLVNDRSSSSDISPQRKSDCFSSRRSYSKKYDSDLERNRKNKSKPRSKLNSKNSNDEYGEREESNRFLEKNYKKKQLPETKITKMIDGKSAGLRTAEDLAKEMKEFRRQECEMLSKSSAYNGEFAEPVIRSNVRTIIETPEEKIKRKKKDEDNEKKREVYNVWGKGVKQVENHKTKILEEEYESSKPLARYANDKDLDDMLKHVEREGDPMLEYLRSKKEKERLTKKEPELPIYKGSYAENRFGIRPGYRWDGVDRSNGYEKKYFEKQSVKQALEEEAYRYSTEDM